MRSRRNHQSIRSDVDCWCVLSDERAQKMQLVLRASYAQRVVLLERTPKAYGGRQGPRRGNAPEDDRGVTRHKLCAQAASQATAWRGRVSPIGDN